MDSTFEISPPYALEAHSREAILGEYQLLWEAYNNVLESRMDLHFELVQLKEALRNANTNH